MIIKSLKPKTQIILKDVCEKVSSIKEGEKIATQLFEELNSSKTPGIGLAANQLGINKRVCVINISEPLFFINPEITERSEETFVFMEGCLSYPNQYIKTIRHKWVKVKADNFDEEIKFDVDTYTELEAKRNEIVTECACIQHEIDHLDGITMFDRKYAPQPIKRAYRKIGRNEKIVIEKDGEQKTLKYKKAEKLMEDDGWALVSIV